MESGAGLETDVPHGRFPGYLFASTIFASLESPRWLLKMGRKSEGLVVLTKISGKRIAQSECAAIVQSLHQEEGHFSELFTARYSRTLFLGVILAGLTQTSGITPVFSYLPSIGLVGLFYYTGGWPLGILIRVMAFVAAHAIGNGFVCWVILSEIFPTKVRGRAMSIATTSLWIFAFLGILAFPMMQKAVGNSGVFWIFSSMAFVNLLFVRSQVLESKGYTLEEIGQKLQRIVHGTTT